MYQHCKIARFFSQWTPLDNIGHCGPWVKVASLQLNICLEYSLVHNDTYLFICLSCKFTITHIYSFVSDERVLYIMENIAPAVMNGKYDFSLHIKQILLKNNFAKLIIVDSINKTYFAKLISVDKNLTVSRYYCIQNWILLHCPNS